MLVMSLVHFWKKAVLEVISRFVELCNILDAATYAGTYLFLVGYLLRNEPKDRNLLEIYPQSGNCSTFWKYFDRLVIFQEQKEELFHELSEVKQESQAADPPAHTHIGPPHSILHLPGHHLDSSCLAAIHPRNSDTPPINYLYNRIDHFNLPRLPLYTDSNLWMILHHTHRGSRQDFRQTKKPSMNHLLAATT